jgi:spermidine/putrescine transport system ATP-binding protein
MAEPLVRITGLSKHFGNHAALTGITVDVAQGEFVALLGPSGCGKTTLLRCIAGFLTPDSGQIAMSGTPITAWPPYRRPLNTVFQNYALFPHLTVIDNVAYGPRRQGVNRREAADRAAQSLELVGLTGFGARFPRDLSGGQQQRVALARAIVNRPKLLLLDEPLSALDLKLRKRMQIELKHLQAKLGIAFVFVTHDQEEAMTMADRIVVMNGGRIEQIGAGPDIYRAPATRFVAGFIGEANLIACTPRPDGNLQPAIGSLTLDPGPVPHGCAALAVLRPEQVRLGADARAPGLSTAPCVIEDVIHIGSHVLVNLRAGSALITCRMATNALAALRPGQATTLGFHPQTLHLIAEDSP